MQETVGTIDLKIARLEQNLKLLKQRHAMSNMYPAYRANLARQGLKVRRQLRQLIQYRQQLV